MYYKDSLSIMVEFHKIWKTLKSESNSSDLYSYETCGVKHGIISSCPALCARNCF